MRFKENFERYILSAFIVVVHLMSKHSERIKKELSIIHCAYRIQWRFSEEFEMDLNTLTYNSQELYVTFNESFYEEGDVKTVAKSYMTYKIGKAFFSYF